MKTPLLLFLCLILLQNTGYAQIIPGATLQPAWVMPFYFEDATGQKDTIYIGYDPDAHWSYTGIDAEFGERLITPDTSRFNVATTMFYSALDSAGNLVEYNVKVAIIPITPGLMHLGSKIELSNFHTPVIMKWDPALLNSDSLPFPSQFPSPKAQVNLTIEYPVTSPACGVIDAPPILLTDTSQYGPGNCVFADSVSFGDPGEEEFYTYFIANIVPWTGLIPIGITEPTPQTLQVFPNPAGNILTLESTLLTKPLPFSIINAQGQLVYQGSFSGTKSSIDISALAPGVYVVCLMDEEGRRVRFVKG